MADFGGDEARRLERAASAAYQAGDFILYEQLLAQRMQLLDNWAAAQDWHVDFVDGVGPVLRAEPRRVS